MPGSSAPAPLALTINEATVDGVSGPFTGNTDESLRNCIVVVSHSDVVRDIQATYANGTDIKPLPDNLEANLQNANALHQKWLASASAEAG